MFGTRVGGIIQRAAHAAADIEAARHADQANGVETIGVLQDLASSVCGDAGGKTVCFDAWATAAISAGAHSSRVSVSVACCAAMREAR